MNGTKEIIVISDGIMSNGSFEQIKKIVLDLKDKKIKIHFVQINIVHSNKPNSLYNELALLSNGETIVLDPEERASAFIDLVQSEESSSEELCSIQINEPSMIRVTLSNGAPIEDVDISFDGNSIGKTSPDGKFIFSTLRPGLHNITATKLRFGNAMKTVRVLPAQTFLTPAQTISSTPVKLRNDGRELNEPINKIEGLETSWLDLIICRLKSILGSGCIESKQGQNTSIEGSYSYQEAPKIYEVQTSQTPPPTVTKFVGADIEKISHELNIMNSKGWNKLAGELGQAKTATVLWYHIKTGYNMDVKMVLGEPNKLDAALAIMVSKGGESNLPKIKIKGAEYYVIYPMTPAIVNEFNYGYIFDEPWGEDNLYAEKLRLSHTDENKVENWMNESGMTIRYTDFTTK